MAGKAKGSRKIGRSVNKCKGYEAGHTRERNKARKTLKQIVESKGKDRTAVVAFQKLKLEGMVKKGQEEKAKKYI